MPRLARVVVSDVPHHVTQRGNRRQPTFFCDEDYEAYLDLMAEWTRRHGVEVWAYCLMPNHVHLVATPPSEAALAHAIGEARRRYTRRVNFRQGWRGHLWQGRFASFPMDEEHLYRAVRYVALNPVRARLVRLPWRYRWSSAAAHLAGQDDRLVRVRPDAGAGGRLAGVPGRAPQHRGGRRVPPPRAERASLGQRAVHHSARRLAWPHPSSPEARPQRPARDPSPCQELSMVSPEFVGAGN
jgi:putative transposase